MIRLRQVTGGGNKDDDLENNIENLIQETNILPMLCQVLSFSDQGHSLQYYD